MKKILEFLKSDSARIIISIFFFVSAFIFEQFDIVTLSLALYIAALCVAGYKVFVNAVKGILRRDLLDEKFLMSIASIGAMIVGEWSEGVAVMIFYLVGETFEHHAVRRSRASIRSLMDISPDEACVLIDGYEEIIDTEDVEVGMTVVIRPGERVPVDSVVISGIADVDTSSMTGEPLPISAGEGTVLSSGFIVKNGLIRARALRPSTESAAARILALVENANENKSKEEAFITKFSRYYTPAVVAIALLVAFIPPIFSLMSLSDAVYTALTFLVISCPCALVISVPMAFFGGIGGAASRGILYKGGNVFSKVATLDSIAFDKTGTLTSGDFAVREIKAFGISKGELLSLVASAESASNHPIAESLSKLSTDIRNTQSVSELAGLGVIAELDSCTVAVGNTTLMYKQGVNMKNIDSVPAGSVFVAKDKILVGMLVISDNVKAEAKAAISNLRALGVKKTVILSGDKKENVTRTKDALGIDECFFELTPEEKYSQLELLISSSKSTMYVGDGINDSPALARADVGVAMGSVGQDAAIEAADMVIMSDNLLKIPEAMLIARKTINISWQNIVFALGVKAIILIIGLLGFANMWLAVFADVGVAVLAILNSMRALKAPEMKNKNVL